jgi:hypothetical protein
MEQGDPKHSFRTVTAASRSGEERERRGPADLLCAVWRKSSWSAHNGNCVEVAVLDGRLIGVRDTKDLGYGPVLFFSNAAWRSFIEDVKNGD